MSLGGFVLERRIGRGGMADVWLGRHHTADLTAAIKVITRQRAADEQYREGFRREVRAVAGLDHPGIVPVYDGGAVPAEAAAASGRALSAGSPWLAMLYAEHGELRRLPRPMTWPLLRDVLLQILDALAHAHARGVIHRDMKPENVLLRVEADRLRLLLTDFGIAHVIEADAPDTGAATHSAGTPQYMAPEQFKGQWRDYGPWTDLYALGCMAFELATGEPPYQDRSLFGIAQKHLTGEIPIVRPVHAMPDGFDRWIRRLMERDLRARYQSAADAAYALGRLSVPSAEETRQARLEALAHLGAAEDGPATVIGGPSSIALASTGDALAHGTLACVLGPGELPPEALFADPRAPTPDVAPPMPDTWFVDAPERPLLRGVGLGLFGVRALPFVDRDAQRDALWDALRAVRATGRSRLVTLEGVEGSGKSRLAEWFVQRAIEVGAAERVTVRHGAMDGPGDAISGAIEGWFRGHGLDQAALEARIRERLTPLDPERASCIAEVDAPALARFLRPDGADAEQAHAMSPGERYGAIFAWLHAMSRRRPVVIVLDDVQWCHDTLTFADWLLHRAEQIPALMVATLRSDLCRGGSLEFVAMERLRTSPHMKRLTIGPLADADHGRVIRDLLGLHPELAEQLLLRSGGNPLFASQIVTDWVERDALEPTSKGYMCNGTALVDVPPDLPTLAGRRVERLAAGFADPGAVNVALEVAAALGHAVHDAEWRPALAALGVTPPEGLEDALYDTGLAEPGRDGWIFGHGFVRDALIGRSRAAGRWPGINRACAEVAHAGRSPVERRARHLMLAGDLEAAIDGLLAAAHGRMDASEYDHALALCDWRDGLIERLGLPEDDLRRAEGMPVRIEALRYRSRFEESARALARLRRFPFGGAEHPRLLAECERLRGGKAFVEGEIEVMADAYGNAIELYRRAGDPRGEARARHGFGWSLMYFGRYDAAERAFAASHRVALDAGLRIDEGWALHGVGAARLFGGRGDPRLPLAEAAAAFAERRLPTGTLGVRLFMGEVCRQTGDLDEARSHITAALEIGHAVGSHLVYLAETAMAMLELDDGRPEAAGARLDAMIRRGDFDRIQVQYRASVEVIIALVELRQGHVEAWRRALTRIGVTRHRAFMHPLSRDALVEMAEWAEKLGHPAEAIQCWRLAGDYWRRIDAERGARYHARAEALAAA